MFEFFKKDNKDSENKQKEKSGIFSGLKKAIFKTEKALISDVLEVVNEKNQFDDLTLDDLEEMLIKSDLGISVTSEIIDKIKKEKIKPENLKEYLKNEFISILNSTCENKLKYDPAKLNIYFITGVNGAGKTTLIAKLANRFKNEGKKVLLACGDTFRAAATDQLEIWAKRAGVEIVQKTNCDPASVVYQAIEKAKAQNYNVLIVDTAGRLQNKINLMNELKKIKMVIDKNALDTNFESILVIDAITGQNGLSQAKFFQEAAGLTGVALTKLDGSSKGAIIISIAKDYKLPVKLIGIGEKIDDIKDFDSNEFIEALFSS